MIGRVAFDGNGNQWLTEMEDVPQDLRGVMDRLTFAGLIRPDEPVEVVGEGWVYMLLMEKYGREKRFCLFQKPA